MKLKDMIGSVASRFAAIVLALVFLCAGAARATTVAQIGETKYTSLAAAVEAVPADGTKTTIQMIADETIDGTTGVMIGTAQDIVLDLNGHTVQMAVDSADERWLIKNEGSMTVKDSAENGKLFMSATGRNSTIGIRKSVVKNMGSFTVEGGTIEMAYSGTNKEEPTAVMNDASERATSFTVNGGTVVNSANRGTGVFLAVNDTFATTFDLQNGRVEGFGAAVRYYFDDNALTDAKLTFKTSGGTIYGRGMYGVHGMTTSSKDWTGISFEISGGTFDSVGLLNRKHVIVPMQGTASVSGGTFNGDVYIYGHSLNITDGNFNGAVTLHRVKESLVSASISGGRFKGAFAIAETTNENTVNPYYNSKLISGGIFSIEPSATYIATGYEPAANTDAETSEAYPYTVNGVGYGGEALPAAPIIDGNTITVTPANIQYTLDGAYGSIDGKTIILSEGTYPKLYFARATKFPASGTEYYKEQGETKYTTIADIQAHRTEWGTCHYNRTMQNVTLRPADGATVTVAGAECKSGHVYGPNQYDYLLDYGHGPEDKGSMYYLSQTVSNITFDGLTFIGKVNFETSAFGDGYGEWHTAINGVTFDGCTFTGSGTASSVGPALRYYSESATGYVSGLTVTDCTFESWYQGVYCNGVKDVAVTKSEFDTTGHNAIAVQTQAAANVGTITITDNTFEKIGDRVIRFGNLASGTEITITGNTATDSGNDKGQVIKAEGVAAGIPVTMSNNSWDSDAKSGNPEFGAAGIGTTYYMSIADAIAAANSQNIDEITILDGTSESSDAAWKVSDGKLVRKTYVAQIGANKYATLAEAFAAVPTTGAETTITMIANSAEPAVITVASGKNVVLDLNGKTVSYTTDAKSVYFLTNEGMLTIEDNSANADGQVLLTAQPDTGYSKETVTIYNCGGTLTLASGTIKNATAGGLAYAVNNSSNAWGSDVVSTFNMEGGTVSAPSGDAALRVYQNTGVGWKVQSKNYVNISGGTILDTGIFFDTYLYTVNQTLPADFAANDTAVGCDIDTVVNISGGTINGLIDMKIRHPYNTRLNITGGDFANCKMWVRKVSNEYGSGLASGTLSEPTESMVYISGGKFAFVTGKAFGLSYDCGATSWTSYAKPYAVSGGVFNVEVPENACVAGKTSIANTETETKDAYPYTVGVAVAKIGTTYYATLADAFAAANEADEAVTITMIANEAIDIAGNALVIAASKNVVLDLNGFQVVGFCSTGENSALILNNGTLTIVDSSDVNADGTGAGKLAYSASPAWNWSGVDGDYSGSYASNLILNNGTVSVESGLLEVINPAGKVISASFAIDSAPGGVVSIKGGKLTSACCTVIRMRVDNSAQSALNISGGSVVAVSPAHRAIWVQGNNGNSTVNISGGLVSGQQYSIQNDSSGSNAKTIITGGTFNGFLFTYSELDISDGAFNGGYGGSTVYSVMAYGKKSHISGGVFYGFAAFYSTASSLDWSVTGGAFSYGGPYQYASYTSEAFVRGGIYDDEQRYIAPGFVLTGNTDPTTKDAYPYAVVPAVASITIGDETTYYADIQTAIADAETGNTVTLLADVTVTAVVEITKSITIDGNGHALNTSATRGIWIDASDVEVTIKNLTIPANSKVERAIQVNLDCDNVTLVIDTVTATATAYTVNVCKDADNLNLTIKDSNITGWGAINLWGNNGTVTIENSTLTGVNDKGYNADGWNNFGVIVVEGDTTGQTEDHASAYDITVNNTAIVVDSTTGNGQTAILYNNPSVDNDITLENCTVELKNANCSFLSDDGADSVTKLKGTTVYGTENIPDLPDGYCYEEDSEGYQIVTPVAVQVTRNGSVVGGYGTLASAISAASEGDTIVLLADIALTEMCTVPNGKDVTLDLAGHAISADENTWTAGDMLLCVAYGAKLTITDSGNGGTIDATTNKALLGAIKMTPKDDDSTHGTATLVVNGGLIYGTSYGISGNGTRQGTSVTVNGGFISVYNEDDENASIGIYQPQNGTLAISGDATIQGATAVYVKSGSVSVSGEALLQGYGAEAEYSASGNGANPTGEALVIDNCGYPGGAPTASITGGYFEGATTAVGSYATTGNTAISGFISGGYYASTVSADLAVLATGYGVYDGTTEYPYAVLPEHPVVVADQTTAISATTLALTGAGDATKFRLDEVSSDGKDRTKGAEQDKSSFSVDLENEMKSATVKYYQIVSLKETGGMLPGSSTTTEDTSSAVIGVMKIENTGKNVIIPIPWASLSSGGEISVANLVRTATLTEGDTIEAYDAGTYKAWTLGSDGQWSPTTVVSEEESVDEGTDADKFTVARGAAVWLTRKDPSTPIYLVGAAASGSASITLEAGDASEPSWNLVGNPTAAAVSVANVAKSTDDKIVVPTATVPKTYSYNEDAESWGYWTTEEVKIGSITAVKSVWKSDDADIPAGTGFWYLNGGEAKNLWTGVEDGFDLDDAPTTDDTTGNF